MKKQPPQKLTVIALAKALGLTRKTLYELRKTEAGPKGTDLEEWRQYLAARALETRDGKSDQYLPDDFKALKQRLLRAQAGKEEAVRKLKELQLRQLEAGLVPMSDAVAAINKVYVPLRALLDGLPKAAAIQANPTDPVHAEEAIRDALDKVFKMMETAADE